MFECWHWFFCPKEEMKSSDNLVSVTNEVRVDNHDSELLLFIIVITQILALILILLKKYNRSLKKKYTSTSARTPASSPL